jgi:hypothetical protein
MAYGSVKVDSIVTSTKTVTVDNLLDASLIGTAVQAYDADTAKLDDATANFTGTLQNGGSNVVVDTDIGVTVQAYDADTAKLDVAQTFTAVQTLTSPTLVTPVLGTPASGNLTNCTFPTLNQDTTGNAATATTAAAVNTANTYQVAALGIGQAAGTGTELDLAGCYAQTSIAVAALDIDCSLGNYFTKTITGTSTFTFSNVPASRSYSFTLCVTHDSGTITWPASVKWPKNIAPTLTTYRKHKFMFITNDGGSVFYAASLVDFTY